MIPHIGPVRLEFVLFALTLVGVALFHTKTMWVALGGLASVLMFKWIFIPDFSLVAHTAGGHGQEGLILLSRVDRFLQIPQVEVCFLR